MKQLIKTYREKLKIAESLLKNPNFTNEIGRIKVDTKTVCYHTFIFELEKILKQTKI